MENFWWLLASRYHQCRLKWLSRELAGKLISGAKYLCFFIWAESGAVEAGQVVLYQEEAGSFAFILPLCLSVWRAAPSSTAKSIPG